SQRASWRTSALLARGSARAAHALMYLAYFVLSRYGAPRALPSFPTPTLFRSAGQARRRRGDRLRLAPEHQQAPRLRLGPVGGERSEEHMSELQSRENLVCRLLLEKKKNTQTERDE